MIARSLFCLLWCSLLSIGLCVLGVAIAMAVQGPETALELLRSWIFDFNGVIVGALGYGLMFFVRSGGRTVLAQLGEILALPETLQQPLVRRQRQAMSWSWANLIAVPTTVVGAVVLWNCGYPLEGFAQYYLAAASITIYYVATNILAFFLFTLAMFHRLEVASDGGELLRLRKPGRAAGIQIESIDLFFVLHSTIGIFAIYFGFRGTLTANFENTPEVFKDLLILPVLLYLPATLCYSLYPRYVFKKISERDTLRRIDETLGTASPPPQGDFQSSLELRKLVLEVREKMLQEHKSTPILGLKDAPSLTLSLVILVQFLWQSDEIVKDFLARFFS